EDDGRAPHAGEIARLVEVSLRRRPVAEARDDDGVRPVYLRARRETNRVQGLGGDGDRVGRDAMLAVVEQASVPRSAEQMKDVRRLNAAQHGESELAVRRE